MDSSVDDRRHLATVNTLLSFIARLCNTRPTRLYYYCRWFYSNLHSSVGNYSIIAVLILILYIISVACLWLPAICLRLVIRPGCCRCTTVDFIYRLLSVTVIGIRWVEIFVKMKFFTLCFAVVFYLLCSGSVAPSSTGRDGLGAEEGHALIGLSYNTEKHEKIIWG